MQKRALGERKMRSFRVVKGASYLCSSSFVRGRLGGGSLGSGPLCGSFERGGQRRGIEDAQHVFHLRPHLLAVRLTQAEAHAHALDDFSRVLLAVIERYIVAHLRVDDMRTLLTWESQASGRGLS